MTAPGPVAVRLTAVAADRPFLIPGSTTPVGLAELGGGAMLVRFPPGWSRPEKGHYLAGEEFVLLDGELHVSGRRYRPGDYAWLPARTPRAASATPDGALAVAWFDAPPRWVAGEGEPPAEGCLHVRLAEADVPPGGLALGRATRLLDHPPAQPAQTLTVGDWRWSPRDTGPPEGGRTLVRHG
ncbi:hypothetical protein [Nonomuraea soli]|uniref:Cupin domain-containing protein n=1 Tax=Nonomuraea soli TaxID=1032476 RepID=A0A7W0CFS6_9ACTN|nr:hypothetical protein [Nonomuraea soli]MBA2890359.1 hypothetical protein [Nonomuraea soli]